MKKHICFLFCILAMLTLVLGGCSSENRDIASLETQSDYVVAEEKSYASSILETENPRPSENLIYEYVIQELYASRDDNQIYGVIYIPQDAGEQLPTVIYAHGYGVTHQNGIQYAEKLAEHGFVVYCFDFCGGGNGSRKSRRNSRIDPSVSGI